ncbi:hypothetical protein [Enterobacter kobei]|uniref:hypothetical protein n=1 Tax=Enterobacter kobei TaxID=208224 RepID=UPI0007955F1F|nr:hypothetical protein [Enterobacter kobei]SAF46234.1 Uncharacterised protein [Enterobacter kobei]
MIQHKKYLACQAWCTPVANLILVKLGVLVGLSKDFNSFIPGLAVVVAHFFLLLLTLINVPSIEDVRFKVDVAKSRKLLEKMKSEATSEKEITEIEEALATLRSKLIAKSLKDVEHSMSVHSNALQGDTEKP